MNPTFESMLHKHQLQPKRLNIKTLQVNIGKRCNQSCHHCHVESGPNRTENMTLTTLKRLLDLLKKEPQIQTVDITGGAPELNPNFRYFVTQARKLGKTIIDRCNLTILFEPNQEDTSAFLANNQVQIVASLPCYLEENVDTQRGKGVFNKSIAALKALNALGYGKADSELILNLVYNPVGEHLPPEQSKLEADYKLRLKKEFGITFNQLFTITNMPIKRYAHRLEKNGTMQEYMQLLINNFNPNSVQNLMCTELISIGWDGQIYDCDFNQMLEIPIQKKLKNIFSIENFSEVGSSIAFESHCFGCTAGSGSSCTGALL